MDILLRARNRVPEGLDSYEVVKELYQTDIKIVYANVLRDLRKLMAIGLVERIDNRYRIKENLKLKELLGSFIKPYIIERILNRIGEYAEKLDEQLS